MARALTPNEYALLVEHSPVMVWRSAADASCDYFNETWLAFTGRSFEQEMGNGWSEGVHREDYDRCLSLYLDHFHRRAPFEMEYRLRRHDGVYRWIFDRGVPFTNESGAFAGFIGSCVDVDERRKAQEAREQRDRKRLALSRDFEKRILAIVSHDIRNPLGTIQLTAAHLQHVAESAGVANPQAESILRAVGRIEHIVNDLLYLAQEREGIGIPIVPKATDLQTMCREVVNELGAMTQDREITFDCHIDGAGAWDERRVHQAISNLASNAVQHGRPGSPVRMRLTGDERHVTLEVENQGTVPEQIVPRLFEPFQSGREYTKRGDGLGLGLFIAKAIARAHGGDLECDSSHEATTFRLVLPRRTPDAPRADAAR
jgi:PAS domain S-box-containing protein